MAMLTSPEEKGRRSRNIVFSALIILLVIWTVKLSFPQHTISLSVSSPNTAEANPVAVPPSTGQEKENQGSSTTKFTSTSTSSTASSSSSSTSTRTRHYKPSPTPWNPQVGTPGTTIASTDETFNGNITNKAAVIVETRFRTNLIPLILHFSTVLGPSWPILIYTDSESIGSFASSAALSRYIRSGLIQLRILPQTVLFTNSDSVNAFMTQRWLWEDLAPAEHILIFQSDSMLCANAARSVDDFFPYDFVGAPIREGLGTGFNGGLSLRKRNTTLRVLDEWTWSPKVKPLKKNDRFEDQWFYNRMKMLQDRESAEGIEPEEEGAVNLPSMEVARTFSVETIDYPHPLGVHQVHRWMGDGILSLDEWCPEYKLCSVEHIEDTPTGH